MINSHLVSIDLIFQIVDLGNHSCRMTPRAGSLIRLVGSGSFHYRLVQITQESWDYLRKKRYICHEYWCGIGGSLSRQFFTVVINSHFCSLKIILDIIG